MMWVLMLDSVIAVAALQMCVATVVYARRSWRATRVGWVVLMLSSTMAVMLSMLFVNQLVHLPDPLWLLVGLAVLASTTTWLSVILSNGQLTRPRRRATRRL